MYRSTSKGKEITVAAELHQIPLLIRGGSIIPTRERPRRSSPLMKKDPFMTKLKTSLHLRVDLRKPQSYEDVVIVAKRKE